MEHEEFLILVAKMRRSQRRFFKTSMSGDLLEARDWERRVDAAIVEFVKARTPGLFWGMGLPPCEGKGGE